MDSPSKMNYDRILIRDFFLGGVLMEKVDSKLQKYIEENIFPIYEQNDSGHRIDHIQYVIQRSLEFAKQFDGCNPNMVYVIAAFHDLAHHIDKNQHEVLSAKLFYENREMKKFFSSDERKIIKEAIEDHRASLEQEPRSDYGKIISSADRNTSLTSSLQRTHAYTKKYYPEDDLEKMIERAYLHISKKFGEEGYAKNYCKDPEYDAFKKQVQEILKNRYQFAVQYMEVNGIMDVKERAKLFAIQAHMGQVRKSEPDKPMIIHPIGVGQLLEEFGYDDNVVAAGYLHDVVEDTKYTIEDIQKEFGEDIANLVMGASEPDKSLSWEERKKHTIEETRKLPLRNKLVICADKINNLEDLFLKFEKSGKRDFSAFKRGEESQRWYYTSIYESLIDGEDKDLPIFQRLKDILDKVFYEKEDSYLRDTIFADQKDYYQELRKLHAQKLELKKLKALVTLPKPFVIEFTGTPRTGKTTTIHNLYDFFKKGGFDVSIVEEFTTSPYYKEHLQKEYDQMSYAERDLAIFEEIYHQLQDAVKMPKDLILIDRSLNDRQIWNYRRLVRGDMPEDLYVEARDKYSKLSKDLIDFLVITYADSLVSLKRDYHSSLALEKRRFLNEENLEEYNHSLQALKDLFEKSVVSLVSIDTSEESMNDVSIQVASQVLPVMRKKYIKAFEKKYHLK